MRRLLTYLQIWASVRQLGSTFEMKGLNMGLPLDPDVVKKAMYKNGYEILEEFQSTKKSMTAKHLKCGEIVQAKYYTVIQGLESCKNCRDKKIRLDENTAVAFMLSRNLQPQTPYVSAHSKWPSTCTICGSYCEPAYSWIKGGQGGCSKCAKEVMSKKTTEAHRSGKFPKTRTWRIERDAIKIMKEVGRLPLEPYTNTKTKWHSKCLACGTEGSPTLAVIIQRGNQCKTCGTTRTADSKKFTQDEAIAIFRNGGVKLLEPYTHDNAKQMKCRCLRCGKDVEPTLASVKRTKEGCKYCAGIFVDPVEAGKLMISFGYEPVEEYKGTDKPWKSIHITCGTKVKPSYGTIRRGGGGCRNCADWGFTLNKPSYVYLISHAGFNAHKVGIANVAKQRKSDRLHKFMNHGWEVIQKWDFDNGAIVMKIEAEVFRVIRKDLGIPPFLKKGTMKYEGETETMDAKLIDLKTLKRIVTKAIKKEIKGYRQ